MDYEKLIKQLRSEAATFRPDSFAQTMLLDAATALSTLQAENEKLRAAVNNWKKKYVETNGKWINAENKWAGLDKAVRNGNVYRPMQEELNLTHEENQSLKDANEKLRDELEQVKRERDEAVEYLRGQCRYCKRNLVCTSRKGPHSNCWEWRGQKED